MRTHTRKMGEIAPRILPQGAKTCFVFSVIKTTRPFGHFPAPILTIFETTDVNCFAHVYTSEKFSNFCAWFFPGPQNSPS